MDYMMLFRSIKDQSLIDVIYHKISCAILPWHRHLTMQEAKDDFMFFFFLVINSEYHFF